MPVIVSDEPLSAPPAMLPVTLPVTLPATSPVTLPRTPPSAFSGPATETSPATLRLFSTVKSAAFAAHSAYGTGTMRWRPRSVVPPTVIPT